MNLCRNIFILIYIYTLLWSAVSSRLRPACPSYAANIFIYIYIYIYVYIYVCIHTHTHTHTHTYIYIYIYIYI